MVKSHQKINKDYESTFHTFLYIYACIQYTFFRDSSVSMVCDRVDEWENFDKLSRKPSRIRLKLTNKPVTRGIIHGEVIKYCRVRAFFIVAVTFNLSGDVKHSPGTLPLNFRCSNFP